ncbi:MAG: 50S ribosomal protein L15e [Candidatus Marsarchaeota archaeon]|jgi:large subunit ribosomal protein L15e|nr:50S ribosomal protein L15e [Candidatus Marsarchaeota archaeon]
MGAYKYIKENFQNSYKQSSASLKDRLYRWHEEPSLVRLEHPTNVARARVLGYKAKQGVVVVRARIRKGLRKREKNKGGRKPSKSGRFFSMKKSFQSIAEERVAAKYRNCEVVNSYYIGEDGTDKYFEVILADRSNKKVMHDPLYSGVIRQRNRANRGLTSSGKKHRGMVPSVRANLRKD